MQQDAVPSVDWLGFLKFLPVFLLGPIVSSGVGGLVAVYIHRSGNTALFDRNIATLAENEQGYVFLAAVVFNLTVNWVNNYPMLYKTMVMRFTSGNLRANMQIYKQVAPASQHPAGQACAGAKRAHSLTRGLCAWQTGKDATDGYVVLETAGPVGAYNRESANPGGDPCTAPAVLTLTRRRRRGRRRKPLADAPD